MTEKKGKRKYLTEFALNFPSARWLMVPSNQLTSNGTMRPEEQEVSDRCHIYLIVKTPSISFEADSFRYEKGILSGNLSYRIEGEKNLLPFNFPFPLLDDAVRVGLSKYPYREIHTFDAHDEIIRYLPASYVSSALGHHVNIPDLHNLEVLYIGQAYADGKRSAFDRLQSHSTLQKILSKCQYDSPDSEINVMMFEYPADLMISSMDPRAKGTIDDESDLARFYSIRDNPLTEHQKISLVEAALIRYFQPEYNKTFKERFPYENQKILESCYDLDFSGLIVEIDTSELNYLLFSKAAAPSEHHISSINLVSHADRHGFFHFTLGDGEGELYPDITAGT